MFDPPKDWSDYVSRLKDSIAYWPACNEPRQPVLICPHCSKGVKPDDQARANIIHSMFFHTELLKGKATVQTVQ
jgi:hypothetical protein